jgi:hypothetical protein
MLGLGLEATASSATWKPTDISGLAIWLKNGEGVAVGQWDDSSGNDNHAVQGTADNQAVVSGGGLTFDGTADYYDFASKVIISTNHNFLIAVVLNIDAYDGDDTQNSILSDGANEFFELETNKKLRIKTLDGSATTSRLTQTAADFDVDEKMLITVSRNDASTGTLNAYKNGSAVADSWSNQTNPKGIEFVNLGIRNDSDRHFDGSIYELLVYDFGTATHTAVELADLHTYLKMVHAL